VPLEALSIALHLCKRQEGPVAPAQQRRDIGEQTRSSPRLGEWAGCEWVGMITIVGDDRDPRLRSSHTLLTGENTMPRAVWNGVCLAESTATEVVEGNHYFPPGSVERQHLRESDTHTVCSWKGTASYYDVVVGDKVNKDAAWYYPSPLPAAKHIAGHVAFWKGVRIEP